MAEAALKALYAPIVWISALALWHITSSLVRASREPGFKVREHLLWLAVVFMLGADLAENAYYGIARYSRTLYEYLGYNVAFVLPMKLLILLGALCACAAYQQAAGRHWFLRRLGQIVALWLAALALVYDT